MQFAGVDLCRILNAVFVAAVSAVMHRLPGRRSRLIPALATGVFSALASPFIERVCRRMWRRRRARQAGVPLTASGSARRPPSAVPLPPPTFRDLQRVIPIAQARTLPSGTLMLLSLESYGDGAIVHGRLRNEQRRHIRPEFICQTIDDAGRQYPASLISKRGNGQTWTFSLGLWQPVDAAPTAIRLELQAIEWYSFRPGKEREVVHVERGPWVFTIDLQSGTAVRTENG